MIRGTFEQLVVERPAHAAATAEVANPGAHVGAEATLDHSELCDDARKALKQMGWKPAIAHAAVQAAAAALRADATLEQLLVEALQRCPPSHVTYVAAGQRLRYPGRTPIVGDSMR